MLYYLYFQKPFSENLYFHTSMETSKQSFTKNLLLFYPIIPPGTTPAPQIEKKLAASVAAIGK